MENVPSRDELIDLVAIHTLTRTEKRFFDRIIVEAEFDPDIIRRVFVIRSKLNHNCPLSGDEAREMLVTLECKDFPLTGLDISGVTLPGPLRLNWATFGGDLGMNNTTIQGLLELYGLKCLGDVSQEGMVVRGDFGMSSVCIGTLKQSRARIEGCFDQQNITADLIRQNGMIVSEHLYQSIRAKDVEQAGLMVKGVLAVQRLHVANLLVQVGMQVDGILDQERMKVGRCVIQHDMHISGNLLQCQSVINRHGHGLAPSLDQSGMRVGGFVDQDGMQRGHVTLRQSLLEKKFKMHKFIVKDVPHFIKRNISELHRSVKIVFRRALRNIHKILS